MEPAIRAASTRAISTPAATGGGERVAEPRSAKAGPARRGTEDLGGSPRQEKEIAESHPPRRADDQVRIGEAAGVEVTRQARLVQLREVGALSRQLVDGI